MPYHILFDFNKLEVDNHAPNPNYMGDSQLEKYIPPELRETFKGLVKSGNPMSYYQALLTVYALHIRSLTFNSDF